jgi:hypothetical protein
MKKAPALQQDRGLLLDSSGRIAAAAGRTYLAKGMTQISIAGM